MRIHLHFIFTMTNILSFRFFTFLCSFLLKKNLLFTGQCRYRIYEQTSIRGNNVFTKTAITWQRCHDLCETVTEITCRSFEYNPVSQYCQLSDTNRWRENNQFAFYVKSWNYYHKSCVTGKTRSHVIIPYSEVCPSPQLLHFSL